VLILMVMPALYWVFTRLGWSLARGWAWARARSTRRLPSLEPPAIS